MAAQDVSGIEGLRIFPRHLRRGSPRELAERLATITWVTSKHFASLGMRCVRDKQLAPNAYAVPLRKTFEELGTTFMKFGQLISSSPGVFGDDVSNEFRSCLDTGPVVEFDAVRLVIEEELGMPLKDAYATFDPDPIGRASIAVVHRATLHDGTDVAVKVLRPSIERRVSVDLDLFEPFLTIIARTTGEYAAGQLLALLEGFRIQLGEELDLRNECRAIQHMSTLLEGIDAPHIMVPEVYPQLSGSRVLTMEFLDGVPVDDLSALEKYGFDPAPVVSETVKVFLLTTIRWGFFHGDVHAGNLLLLSDGRLGVIDWGIIGRLDPDTHEFFRNVVRAALGEKDAWTALSRHTHKTYGRILDEAFDMDEQQLALFMQAVLEPLLTAPFGEVSLAEILNAPQMRLAEARGIEIEKRTIGAIFKRFREQRKVRLLAEAEGVYETEFERGLFLLTKSLMYFERYGKIYLSDVGIFEDEEFFKRALAGASTLSA